MTSRFTHYAVAGTVVVALVTCGELGRAEPVDLETRIIVDGISVLAGSHGTTESEATPILLSDIEFESALVLSARLGPVGAERPPTEEDWYQARRRATMIRLLASQARRLNESVTPSMKRQLLNLLTNDMGGQAALKALVTRLGMSSSALNVWLEDAALAMVQIRYLRAQVDLPSKNELDQRITADHGDEPVSRQLRDDYSDLIRKEKVVAQIERWLADMGVRQTLRVIR